MPMLTGGVRICKRCNGEGHTAFNCPHRPRKQLQAKKRFSKVGKMAKKYIDLRKEYLTLYPAPHYCYYCIYIGIEEELEEKHIQVEHYYTKANHPKLRLDMGNLVKSCATHNQHKGGLDAPEFLQILDKQMEKGSKDG